jgi:serine/threonine protein kinase
MPNCAQYSPFFAAHARTAALSSGAVGVLSSMLVWDPEERASVADLLAHPWLTTLHPSM